MRKSLASGLMVFFSVVGILTIALLLVYTGDNTSGHTGVNPWWAVAAFIPCILYGIRYLFLKRRCRSTRWFGVMAVLVGCLGIALLVYLDVTGTLLYYETWIQRGMP